MYFSSVFSLLLRCDWWRWSGAELHQTSAHFQISMLDIYNETLNDLLTKSSDAALDIRVQGKSVSVPGLTRIQVQTEADILAVMETGEKNRKIASTKMNTQRCSNAAQEEVLLMKLRFHLIIIFFFILSSSVLGLTWWWRWRWRAQMKCQDWRHAVRWPCAISLDLNESLRRRPRVRGWWRRPPSINLWQLWDRYRTSEDSPGPVLTLSVNQTLLSDWIMSYRKSVNWSAHTHHLYTVLTLSSEVCRLSLRCSVLSGATPSTSPSGTLSSRSCCSPASAGTQRYPPSFYNHRRSVFTTEERCVSSWTTAGNIRTMSRPQKHCCELELHIPC